MMKKNVLKIIILMLSVILLLINCKKDELTKITKLETGIVSNITKTSATVSATFNDISENISEYGHCWNTSGNPQPSDNKYVVASAAKKGEYTSSLTGLTADTKYYVRAYAVDGDITIFGTTLEFDTNPYVLPSVNTSSVTAITHESASCGGEVTDDGGESITARGVCWSTSHNPTISNPKTNNGTGSGTFSSELSGLSASTTYYARAYATSVAGTSYGNEVEFTTNETPYIEITWPVTEAHWLGLDTANIEWETNITGNVKIELIKGSSILTEIVSSTQNDGFHQWANVLDGQYNTDYIVRVSSLDVAGCYDNSATFKISESTGTTGSLIGNQKTYKTIKIGYQWWMAENLQEWGGTDVIEIQIGTDWAALGSDDKAFCSYNNSYTNREIYGYLYTWAAAMNGANSSDLNPSGIQGICPVGWHLPSDAEWKELEMYLGIDASEINDQGYRGTNEGSKLAGNADLWNDPTIKSDSEFNSSGFTALPGGVRRAYEGTFQDLGDRGYWWCSTLVTLDANNRMLSSTSTSIYRYYDGSRPHGFSVRCVRD